MLVAMSECHSQLMVHFEISRMGDDPDAIGQTGVQGEIGVAEVHGHLAGGGKEQVPWWRFGEFAGGRQEERPRFPLFCQELEPELDGPEVR